MPKEWATFGSGASESQYLMLHSHAKPDDVGAFLLGITANELHTADNILTRYSRGAPSNGAGGRGPSGFRKAVERNLYPVAKAIGGTCHHCQQADEANPQHDNPHVYEETLARYHHELSGKWLRMDKKNANDSLKVCGKFVDEVSEPTPRLKNLNSEPEDLVISPIVCLKARMSTI
ncbi:hypothetical protein N7454_005415 [Penicillium verhagenii]|nr:hypothetical protein N7454_005415 [Penicillium verhagenii]